jgi:multisubunit Na+/H+ antiporter MnhG subunit
MTDTPAKKSQMPANLAGVGLIVGAIGVFLGWRASNLEQTSAVGTLFILAAGVLLIAALVAHALRNKH